ncbi:hypothetical protein [Candidatus Nitrosocosmicus sp. R]
MINKNEISSNLLLLSVASMLALSGLIYYTSSSEVFAQANPFSDNNTAGVDVQPNINAENIFNTKTMTLGNNIKNLVILIPNDGHHAAGEDNESRFLDQYFVTESAIVNTGTTVQWFSGDTGHERTIDVKDTDGSTSLFNTGEIVDSQASTPLYL